MKIPKEEEPPEPPGPECLMYLRAWHDLSATRQMGFNGPQPIQFVDIAAWLDIQGWTDLASRGAIVTVVRALDQVFLQHVASSMEAAAKEQQKAIEEQRTKSKTKVTRRG